MELKQHGKKRVRELRDIMRARLLRMAARILFQTAESLNIDDELRYTIKNIAAKIDYLYSQWLNVAGLRENEYGEIEKGCDKCNNIGLIHKIKGFHNRIKWALMRIKIIIEIMHLLCSKEITNEKVFSNVLFVMYILENMSTILNVAECKFLKVMENTLSNLNKVDEHRIWTAVT